MNPETKAATLPDGLQLAVRLLAEIGDEQSDAAISAVHDLRDEHAQRLKAERTLIAAGYTDCGGELWKPPLGPSASPLLERITELEAELAQWKQNARNVMDSDLVQRAALEQEGEIRKLEAERDELRARLAEIEAEEPAPNDDIPFLDCPLYAAPVPAQGVPMSDERIDAIADLVIKGMPEGIRGFMRGWGWQHFARELLDVCAGHYRATQQAAPDGWRLALTEARDLFAAYAESHRARGPEHAGKAARNEAMAAKISAALAASPEAAR